MAPKKWSAKVQSESTHPPEGLFKKDAATIAKSLASKKVSPKGPASGMRMLNFFINRAGKTLPASRQKVLERAKHLLSGIIAEQKEKAPAKKAAKKSIAKKPAKKTPAKKTARTSAKKAAKTSVR